MPTGYRLLIAAIGGITVLIALGAGAFVGSLYSPGHKQYQAVAGGQGGQSDYAGPSQSMPDIAGLPGPVERLIANPRPPGGEDHEKRDLAAQEASALWAFWMVVGTFASVLITTIGTIFLYKQIVLTREAVEDTGLATKAMGVANQISRESRRPWLTIESIEVRAYVTQVGDTAVVLNTRPTLVNTGGFPAFNVKAYIKSTADYFTVEDDLDSFVKDYCLRFHYARSTVHIAPHARHKFLLQNAEVKLGDSKMQFADNAALPVIYLHIVAVYQIDPSETERNITAQTYAVSKSSNGNSSTLFPIKEVIWSEQIMDDWTFPGVQAATDAIVGRLT